MSEDRNVSTRREFIGRGLTLAAAAGTVPTFLSRAAYALDDRAAGESPARRNTDQPVLVVVQLAGGNDGLNTVVPYADDAYRSARPTLGIKAADLLKVDDHVAFHPSLAPLKQMYDSGELCVVQGVGYPNPNRSHFRSMEIWETASDSDKYARLGWIGRFFDNACAGQPDPTVGVRIGGMMPQSFRNGSSAGISLQHPEQYQWQTTDRRPAEARKVFRALNQPAPGAPAPLDFLQRTALNANLSSDRILELTRQRRTTVEYPNTPLAADLKTIAQLIAGGLGTRIYYATLGGFDTHAQQEQRHAKLLEELAGALAAFNADLKAQKNHERVLVMTFSEFGRRVQENASGGTDHGAASLLFLAGAAVKPGLAGRYPSLTDLNRGDLAHQVDFREVYAAVLQRWLRADAGRVLGRAFAEQDLLRV